MSGRTAALLDEIEEGLSADGLFHSVPVPHGLRSEFASFGADYDRPFLMLATPIGIALYQIFLIVSYSLTPDIFALDALVRVTLCLPIGLCAIAIVFGEFSIEWQRFAGAYTATVYAAWLSAMGGLSTAPGATLFLTANNIILLYVIVMFQLPIITASIVSCIIIAFTMVSAWTSPHMGPPSLLAHFMISASITGSALFTAFRLANQRRRQFLMFKRDELRMSQLQTRNEELGQLSTVDPLTKLANRRTFDAYLRDVRTNPSLVAKRIGLIMIDIDHFKPFNDNYGHVHGDRALRQVADTISHAAAGCALTARFGGEEFAVICHPLQDQDLSLIAEAIREGVVAAAIRHEFGPPAGRLTVSLGYTSTSIDKAFEPDPFIESADAALYLAKSNGRNQAVAAEHLLALAANTELEPVIKRKAS